MLFVRGYGANRANLALAQRGHRRVSLAAESRRKFCRAHAGSFDACINAKETAPSECRTHARQSDSNAESWNVGAAVYAAERPSGRIDTNVCERNRCDRMR